MSKFLKEAKIMFNFKHPISKGYYSRYSYFDFYTPHSSSTKQPTLKITKLKDAAENTKYNHFDYENERMQMNPMMSIILFKR